MFYLLWSGCRMSLPTFTRVHSIPKWVWCKHQNGKIKLYLSAICISGAAANTLMSACWPQFRTVKQKNLIMFSVDGRGLWLGASDQSASQRPATFAKVRQSSRHPFSISQTVTVDGKCEGLQRPINTARNTILFYSICVHVWLKWSQIYPNQKPSTKA